LFEVERIQQLANQLGVEILAKVIFTFTPDIIMSPLALPRKILNRVVDTLIKDNKLGNALQDVLEQLKHRLTMEEQFPDYVQGMQKGKRRLLKLESIRNDQLTMQDILSEDKEILNWWNSIDAG